MSRSFTPGHWSKLWLTQVMSVSTSSPGCCFSSSYNKHTHRSVICKFFLMTVWFVIFWTKLQIRISETGHVTVPHLFSIHCHTQREPVQDLCSTLAPLFAYFLLGKQFATKHSRKRIIIHDKHWHQSDIIKWSLKTYCLQFLAGDVKHSDVEELSSS